MFLKLLRKKMVKTAKESMQQQASTSEIYGKMHQVFIEMDSAPSVSDLIPLFCFWETEVLAICNKCEIDCNYCLLENQKQMWFW